MRPHATPHSPQAHAPGPASQGLKPWNPTCRPWEAGRADDPKAHRCDPLSLGHSQERTGESGAFGLWPHPRGSSRISS